MRKTLYQTLVATSLGVALAAPDHALATQQKALHMLFDVGPAGAPMRDDGYSKHVAGILSQIAKDVGLGQGDTLTLRSFGNPNVMEHLTLQELNRDIEFSYRGAQAEDVPAFLHGLLPKLKGIAPHGNSDLMFGLAGLSEDARCGTHDVTTVIVSNFREVGTVSSDAFALDNVPDNIALCGRLFVVGFWVSDPNQVAGIKGAAKSVVSDLATMIGMDGNVTFKH